MISPIKWIKPRLRSLCVAFGVADMTLVVLSSLFWYFVFDSAFEAQHIHNLFKSQNKNEAKDINVNDDDVKDIKKFKEDRSSEELRLERTIRACGYIVDEFNRLDETLADSNYAVPAAMIGAAMGSFFVLGALLASINAVSHPAARRVICAVALFGEGASIFFLFIGVTILSTNDGLCRTEYYYESFQPVLYLFVFTMIFIFTYKIYEITIIAFCLAEQTIAAKKEMKEVNEIRRSGGPRGSLSADIKTFNRIHPQAETPEAPKEYGGPGDAGLQEGGGRRERHKSKRHSRDQGSSQQHERRKSKGPPNDQDPKTPRQRRYVSHGRPAATPEPEKEDGNPQRQIRLSDPAIDAQGVKEESEQRKKRQPKASSRDGHRGGKRSNDNRGHRRHQDGDDGGGGGGGEGSSRKHHHHHPLHPTKNKPKADPDPKPNLEVEREMEHKREEYKKGLLNNAVTGFNEMGVPKDEEPQ